MWFWLSVAALLCWSGSDLFSKIGCRDPLDRYSHLMMLMTVGMVMGLHAAFEIFVGGTKIDSGIILSYLPVSALYILSMAIGYLGLRYIELSISSPICNSSGAVVAVLIFATQGFGGLPPAALCAVALVCVGVTALGIVEANEDEELRSLRQDEGNFRYAKSAIAIALPIIYCLLDALGTFADTRVLMRLDEASANVAYELTFFAVGIVCGVYALCIKKRRITFRAEAPKLAAAVFETGGQLAYIYALSDTAHAALAAPVISSYCVLSLLWGRIFLKEKLSKRHYASVAVVIVGIIILGILDI